MTDLGGVWRRPARWVGCAWLMLALWAGQDAARAAAGGSWLTGAKGYTEAARLQEKREVPMWVYFYTDWCPYCRRMDKELIASSEVGAYLGDIVAVRINPERGDEERALEKQFGASGYPSFFVVAPGSAEPKKIYPYRKDGEQWVSMTPAEFVQACQKAGEEKAPKKRPKPSVAAKAQHPSLRRIPVAKPAAAPSPAARSSPLRNQVTLHLKNGGIVVGELVRETPQLVTLRWDYGEMEFQRAEIDRLVKEAPEAEAAPAGGSVAEP